jgi:hypothetical protein
MALRKCPGCKNIIAAETESCPICGCNPRTRRLRKFVVLAVALGATAALFQGQLRQHIPGMVSPDSAHAQTAVSPE